MFLLKQVKPLITTLQSASWKSQRNSSEKRKRGCVLGSLSRRLTCFCRSGPQSCILWCAGGCLRRGRSGRHWDTTDTAPARLPKSPAGFRPGPGVQGEMNEHESVVNPTKQQWKSVKCNYCGMHIFKTVCTGQSAVQIVLNISKKNNIKIKVNTTRTLSLGKEDFPNISNYEEPHAGLKGCFSAPI